VPPRLVAAGGGGVGEGVQGHGVGRLLATDTKHQARQPAQGQDRHARALDQKAALCWKESLVHVRTDRPMGRLLDRPRTADHHRAGLAHPAGPVGCVDTPQG